MNDHELAMLAAINAARVGRGVHALTADYLLATAAQRHAEDMVNHPGMEHIGSDGTSGGDRLLQEGYYWQQWLEIIGWGWSGDIAPMVAWWLNSPPHAAIIMDADMVDIGVGYATGGQWGAYWTVDFGRRSKGPTPPPRRYTSHVPVVVGGTVAPGIDLLAYLCGDGRAYRVGNQRGTFEVMQSQREGDRFYQVKAWDDLSIVHWEEFTVTDELIGRDVDTSPGGGRYYRQFGAPWVKRHMRPGESFTQGKRVQFFNAADCSESAANSGDVTDTITLVEQLRGWRSVFGVEVDDVITLRWEQGGELYTFGKGLGLCAWRRLHGDQNSPEWSAISEMRPDVGRLNRLRIPCLD